MYIVIVARLTAVLTILHVSSIKIDPYLNVDAGTMNPKEYDKSMMSIIGLIY
jgi:CTP synthase (UTP-ammonia lyase)